MTYTVADIDRMRHTVAQLINWERYGMSASHYRPDMEHALLIERRVGTYIAADKTPDELAERLNEVREEKERQRREAEERRCEHQRQEEMRRAFLAPVIVEGSPPPSGETPWWLRLYKR